MLSTLSIWIIILCVWKGHRTNSGNEFKSPLCHFISCMYWANYLICRKKPQFSHLWNGLCCPLQKAIKRNKCDHTCGNAFQPGQQYANKSPFVFSRVGSNISWIIILHSGLSVETQPESRGEKDLEWYSPGPQSRSQPILRPELPPLNPDSTYILESA